MGSVPTNVAILGSTGSIGKSALDVIAGCPDQLRCVALSANRSVETLAQQAEACQPRWIAVADEAASQAADWSQLPSQTEVLSGPESIVELAARPEVDIVLAAIVGSAGLRSTWAALEAGKTVALANKETLVMAGPLVMDLARKHGGKLLPVDSEHSGVFQCLQSGRRDEVRRVVLTASGGPFRNFTSQQLAQVTVEQALNHPTWQMGPKITVDSATMMNKALEIMEARWLFDLQADQIGAVIHPQSIVHALVEYTDGSVVAQLSPPDMRLPIQYALTYPSRKECVADKLDWSQTMRLDFEPPDLDRFPALRLGLQSARDGGTTGAVLNAANEEAVARFLAGEMAFLDIVPACERVLANHNFDAHPSLDQLLKLDRWAREEVTRWVTT